MLILMPQAIASITSSLVILVTMLSMVVMAMILSMVMLVTIPLMVVQEQIL